MLHRALKTCSRWSAMGCILALSSALSAQVAGETAKDPNGEYQIAEGVIRSAANQQNPRLTTLLKEGAEAYRRAEFSVAMDFYEDASRIAPENAEIQSLLQLAGEKRTLQRQALETIPKTKSKRDQYYKALYDQGRDHFKNKDFGRAYEVLYSLWLVRGDYKDTLDLIEKSRGKAKIAEPEPAAPAAIEPPAESQPAAAEAAAPAPAEAAATEPEAPPAAIVQAASAEAAAAEAERAPVEVAALAPEASPKAETAAVAERVQKSPPLDPESKLKVDTLTLEAQIEAQAGRLESAMALYEQALQVDPNNRVVLRGMDKLRNEIRAAESTAAQIPAERAAAVEVPASQALAVTAEPAPAPVREAEIASLPAATEPQPLAATVVRAEPAQAIEATPAEIAPAPAELAPAPAEPVLAPAQAEVSPAAAPQTEPPPAAAAAAPRAENVGARVTALVSQAKAAQENGKLDFAEELYREALSLDGSNRAAEKGLAKVQGLRVTTALSDAEAMAKANRPEEAVAKYQEALKADPANKKAKKGLELAQTELAKAEQLAASAKLDAEVAGARQEIAAGNFPAARIALQSVLAQSPNHAGAASEMVRLGALEAAAAKPAEAQVAALAPEPAAEIVPEPAAAAPAPEAAPPTAAPFSINAEKIEAEAAATKPSFEVAQADAAAPAAAPAAPQTADDKRKRRADLQARQQQLDELFARSLRQYKEQKDLEAARKTWEEMLAIEPGEKRAQTYLAETQAEFNKHQEDLKLQDEAAKRRKDREELLNSPITIQTERPTPLAEFIRLISFSTAKELQYYVAEGAQADIYANFVDKPLGQLLDEVLRPIGLAWEINDNNLITIKPELGSQTFNLDADQINKVRSLLDNGTLQQVIWGQAEPPAKGVEITLDERQRVLVVVGSKIHLDKMQNLLASLDTAVRPDLDMKIYRIREEDGPKIKALINAMISAEAGTPFDLERKLFIDGSDLIIRDTPDNILKIEELLLDDKFIEDLRDERLEISNFSLIPRDVENRGSDFVTAFTGRVVESIETFLYARTGKSAAQGEGRRLWYDPATFQLTIVDTPTNINRVGSFINSLPELRQRKLQEVVFLEHAVAEELSTELAEVLQLQGTEGGAGGRGGDEVVRRLRRGERFEFRDLRITLTRVEEGDPNDRNDDEVELSIVSGTQSSQITVRELETTFFEDYEISVEDVQPSGSSGGATGGGQQNTRRGEGTAKVFLRYVPPIDGVGPTGQAIAPAPGDEAAPAEEEPAEDLGITINPFGPLNALIIRYDNPAIFEDVQDLIGQLDKPTKQVEVETKFVSVDETRAKEFSADINLAGLDGTRNFNTDFWQMNSRFAQNVDEFRDSFEPNIESPLASNLLKGTGVLEFVLGRGAPSVSFQLRVLEAEGILNITNGPKILMQDGVEGEFRIEKIGPFGSGQGNATGPFAAGGQNNVIDLFGQGAGGGQEDLVNEDSSQFESRLTSVILLVTPEITSEKSIILEIEAEILDFDSNVGVDFFNLGAGAGGGVGNAILDPDVDPIRGEVGQDETGQPVPIVTGPYSGAVLNSRALLRTRKLINTTARIGDGGTIVLGGWTGERSQDLTSGVPVLRNMPYFGKLLFSRNQRSIQKTTMLVFLTGNLID